MKFISSHNFVHIPLPSSHIERKNQRSRPSSPLANTSEGHPALVAARGSVSEWSEFSGSYPFDLSDASQHDDAVAQGQQGQECKDLLPFLSQQS
jgi:hypothetical protein